MSDSLWSPDSSVYGISQARILEWAAISFSRGSSQLRDRTWVSCIAGRRFTLYAKGQIHIPILKCCMAKPAVPLMSSKSAPCTLYTKIIQSQWQAWMYVMGFPGGSDCKESACNERDLDLIHGLGGSPGGGHGNPLQYSCLENPQGQRSQLGYSPWGCKQSDTTEPLSTAHVWQNQYNIVK